jgi:hypothetical protein
MKHTWWVVQFFTRTRRYSAHYCENYEEIEIKLIGAHVLGFFNQPKHLLVLVGLVNWQARRLDQSQWEFYDSFICIKKVFI